MSSRILIIGAGPGGYTAALQAARLGGNVTVVERENVGGVCLNWGCIPSKVMRNTAEWMEKMERAAEFGLRLDGTVMLDIEGLMRRKQEVIADQSEGILKLFHNHKVRYLQGRAELSGPKRAVVALDDGGRTEVEWDRLILATGSRPMALPGRPFDGERILSSNDILNLKRVPDSIVIVGAGVIGCEFAFILRAFGAEVTLVEALDRVLPLPSVDEACSRTLAREMKKRKIRALVARSVDGIEEHDGRLQVAVGPSPLVETRKKSPKPETIIADQVLVCIGRRPNIEGLGLETLSLALDERGWIQADDRLETDVPGVFAIGDALGPARIMLAHVASNEALVAAENVMGGNRTMRYDTVPGAIFTMPEVANVGLTETQARERFPGVKTAEILFRNVGKAQVLGETAGLAKIVADAGSGRLVGCHLVGPHATDLIAEGALAVRAGLTARDVAETIHAHPTLAEIMGEAALKLVHDA
ncbi:MAG: dihydrolipoyl dehydrogenase [Proteobacteria bacterium]|nr:dihydrolipoyl dehydrogenase [Pseudomonadota bacterium]